MLVKVPANIKGSSALKVHQWVMSQSGSDNYVLQDATTANRQTSHKLHRA